MSASKEKDQFSVFKPKDLKDENAPHYLDENINMLNDFLSENAQKARKLERPHKELVYGVRETFFRDLLNAWATPPTLIDEIMEQANTYMPPDYATHKCDDPQTIKIFDVKQGLLVASVTPKYEHLKHGNLRWVYSIWQAGDWIRFGVLIQGTPEYITAFDNEHDNVLGLERIWDCTADFLNRAGKSLLVEWRFNESDFYENFEVRERFILVAKHLHFRLSSMFHDLIKRLSEAEDAHSFNQNIKEDRWSLSNEEKTSLFEQIDNF